MSDREQRGLAIAALYRIEQVDGKYVVPSQSGNGTKYIVDPAKNTCTCRDHEDRAIKCKHMFAVEFIQTRERNPDGTETVTETLKVTKKTTYKQDWSNYNKAQTREKREFLSLLCDLCKGIDVPERNKSPMKGRPTVPIPELVFAVVYKVYSTLSGRRFTCDLQEAVKQGLIDKAPHYNTVGRGMEDPQITPILKALIVETSKPLAAVETAFAVDSSGFSTCRFVRWFDMKYGKTVEEREWVKVHIMCGVKTNVISAVEILDKNAADSPQLPPLLATTRKSFGVKEVSADAAYLSHENVNAVNWAGATPFIFPKENTTGSTGGLFAKMFHYYQFKQDEFLKHYHKRSNVESTFSMVKAKFGDSLRSKTDVSMINEALCKLLCHNLCCIISSIYELGINPIFWSHDVLAELDTEEEKVEDLSGVDQWAWI
jgi:transposase